MSKSDSHKPHVVSVDNTPPEQLSAWERWQLPNMEAGQARRENALNYPDRRPPPDATAQAAPEPELRPLTADDLEAIRQAAYAEGLEQGRRQRMYRASIRDRKLTHSTPSHTAVLWSQHASFC